MRILSEEVDYNQNILQINHPAKKCNSRSIRISGKLHDMLIRLPTDRQKLFKYKTEKVAGKTFREMRKRAVAKLGIKELRKITLYTFRYWRATVEYQETGKEGAVMILLGHKSTKYIYKYVQLAAIYFGGEKKYISQWVTTREQETKIVEEGYELVRTDPKDGASLYRKLDRKASAHFTGSSLA